MNGQENGTYDNNIMDTLYIPLFARAKENEHPLPIINDPKAAEIIAKVPLKEKLLDGGNISTLGIISRTKIIDDAVYKLTSSKGNAVIINLGVGLDTRISRMSLENVDWYNIDFPKVITLRKKFFEDSVNAASLPESILDYQWMSKIDTTQSELIIIIAEGLLMYFTENQVRYLFSILGEYFPYSHMLFDVVHSYFVGKKISSSFRWGLDHAETILQYAPSISLIQSWSTGNLHKNRQSKLLRALNILPATRNRSQILHITFKPKELKDA